VTSEIRFFYMENLQLGLLIIQEIFYCFEILIRIYVYGLGVACWPLVPKFAGSNPAEAVGFFKGEKKSSARLPSEGK